MVLSVMAHINVLDSPAYLNGHTPDLSPHDKPHAWRKTMERALAERTDDFLAHVAYSRVLFELAVTEAPELTDRAYVTLDRAIDLLATWPEGPSQFALAFDLYNRRAAAFAGDPEALSEAMKLAFNPPGVAAKLYGPPCYEP
jgi:hypothetical protein